MQIFPCRPDILSHRCSAAKLHLAILDKTILMHKHRIRPLWHHSASIDRCCTPGGDRLMMGMTRTHGGFNLKPARRISRQLRSTYRIAIHRRIRRCRQIFARAIAMRSDPANGFWQADRFHRAQLLQRGRHLLPDNLHWRQYPAHHSLSSKDRPNCAQINRAIFGTSDRLNCGRLHPATSSSEAMAMIW